MTKHEEALKKLKPGDRVRVMRQIERHADGWQNSWEPEMTRNIGKVFTIKRADGPSGVLFEEPSSGHRYPAHGLMLEHSLSGYFQKGDRVRVRERSKSHAYGWGQCWNKHGRADKMEVGVIGTIEEIQCHDNYGVMLDNGCYFPEWTLEHAPAEEAAAVAPAATNLARNRDPDREVQTFKVGDTVRVVCKPNYAPSWNATRMDHLVYKQGMVDGHISYDALVNVLIEGESRAWSFPPNSLMLVKDADGNQASSGSSSKPTVQQRGAIAGKSGKDMAKEQRVLRCRSFDGTRLGDEDVYFSALQSWLAYSNYDGWIWSSDQKHKPSNCWYVVEVLPYDDSFALLREIYGTGDVLDGLGSKADAARAAVALAKGDLKPGPIVEAPPEEERRFAIIPIDMSDIELRTIDSLSNKDAWLYGTFEPERYDKDRGRRKCGDDCPFCRAEKRSSFAGDDGMYDYQQTLATAIAKFAAATQNISRSTTSQESTMSNIRIETHTFVNGVKVQDLSQDAIVDIITGAERELAKMKSVNTQTRALKAKISKLEGEIARLVELSDERYAKDNPGEAPGTSADV